MRKTGWGKQRVPLSRRRVITICFWHLERRLPIGKLSNIFTAAPISAGIGAPPSHYTVIATSQPLNELVFRDLISLLGNTRADSQNSRQNCGTLTRAKGEKQRKKKITWALSLCGSLNASHVRNKLWKLFAHRTTERLACKKKKKRRRRLESRFAHTLIFHSLFWWRKSDLTRIDAYDWIFADSPLHFLLW